jgi:hypothetical protein
MVKIEQVNEGDIVAILTYAKVKGISRTEYLGVQAQLIMTDIDRNEEFGANGKDLIETFYSADAFALTQTVNKTELARILSEAFNVPFTVVFDKDNGEERTLRGRLISSEPLMGRVYVSDLDVVSKHDPKDKGVRLVDNRHLKSLIVRNTKYIVK